MSFRAVTWAFDHVEGVTASEKLVLLALAEFANDEDVTWRSIQTVAKRAISSPYTTRKHLATLESYGFISREPRYAWCDSEDVPCATRPAHKHRCGTLYKLHLERTIPLKEEVSTTVKAVDNSELSTEKLSTGNKGFENEKPSNVEKSAENQGKVHRWQKATCGDGTKSTGGNSAASQVAIVPTICTYNPHINPHPYHPNPSVTFSGVDNPVGVDGVDGKIPGQNCVVEDPGVGVGEPPARSHTAPELPGSCDMHAVTDLPGELSDPGEVWEQSTPGKPCEPGESGEILPGSPTQGACADSVPGLGGGRVWALLRECLPVSLLALVTGGEKAIVGCLRELVGLGWQPFQIRELLS
ncbi:helix-turn-helix domain-containing protein, partial [Actinotignum urinale]